MRALAALALLYLCGCGYRFTAGGAPFPDGIRSVRAPMFVNRTSEAGLEAVFTQAMRQQLARSGSLAGEGAEAAISGEILFTRFNPNIPARNLGRAVSYRLEAGAKVRLLRGERTVVEAEVVAWEDFLPGVDADVTQTEAARAAALRRLAETLVRDGLERLSTGF